MATTAQSPATLAALPTGVMIRVRYLGPTDHRGSRWVATCKRSADQVFRAVLPYEHDGSDYRGQHAALACLAKINADRATVLPDDRPWVLIAAAHDDDAYYYVASYPA